VTKDDIPDPYSLGVPTYPNGEIRQEFSTGAMTVRIEMTGLSRMETQVDEDPYTG